jgi:hypothetical protein
LGCRGRAAGRGLGRRGRVAAACGLGVRALFGGVWFGVICVLCRGAGGCAVHTMYGRRVRVVRRGGGAVREWRSGVWGARVSCCGVWFGWIRTSHSGAGGCAVHTMYGRRARAVRAAEADARAKLRLAHPERTGCVAAESSGPGGTIAGLTIAEAAGRARGRAALTCARSFNVRERVCRQYNVWASSSGGAWDGVAAGERRGVVWGDGRVLRRRAGWGFARYSAGCGLA